MAQLGDGKLGLAAGLASTPFGLPGVVAFAALPGIFLVNLPVHALYCVKQL